MGVIWRIIVALIIIFFATVAWAALMARVTPKEVSDKVHQEYLEWKKNVENKASCEQVPEEEYYSCDNCYYEYFDGIACPCSRCDKNDDLEDVGGDYAEIEAMLEEAAEICDERKGNCFGCPIARECPL